MTEGDSCWVRDSRGRLTRRVDGVNVEVFPGRARGTYTYFIDRPNTLPEWGSEYASEDEAVAAVERLLGWDASGYLLTNGGISNGKPRDKG